MLHRIGVPLWVWGLEACEESEEDKQDKQDILRKALRFFSSAAATASCISTHTSAMFAARHSTPESRPCRGHIDHISISVFASSPLMRGTYVFVSHVVGGGETCGGVRGVAGWGRCCR